MSGNIVALVPNRPVTQEDIVQAGALCRDGHITEEQFLRIQHRKLVQEGNEQSFEQFKKMWHMVGVLSDPLDQGIALGKQEARK